MAFSKVTDEMRAGKGNVGKPDTPELTTTEMQEVMDELGNLALDFINDHIDELGATTAAANIGATVPNGVTANENLQSILAALAVIALESSEIKHTHANKTTIDAITDTVKEGYDSLVQTFDGIENVQRTMTNSDTAVPTSSAVENYVGNYDISEKVFNFCYPIGTIFMTTATVSPAALLGYGTWTQLGSTDQYGINRYVRSA